MRAEGRRSAAQEETMRFVVAALVILGVLVLLRAILGRAGLLRRWHQVLVGFLTLSLGLYLALFTGSVLELVVPGLGSLALGTGAGAGVGLLTWLAIGTVGVATGGVGLAVGAMSLMGGGALLGGIAAFAGGMLVRQPVISPWFWGTLVVLGGYLIYGAGRRSFDAQRQPASLELPPPSA